MMGSRQVIPTCVELGIGMVAYSPLGRGFLTGAIKKMEDLPANDFRSRAPRFADGALDANLQLLARRTARCCTPRPGACAVHVVR